MIKVHIKSPFGQSIKFKNKIYKTPCKIQVYNQSEETVLLNLLNSKKLSYKTASYKTNNLL